MKKKLLLLATLLVFVLTIGGPAAATPIKLRYADHNPESGEAAQRATIPLLKRIEAATDNAVVFETYFGETLFKTRDTWDGIKNGVADVGWMVMAYWPGKTPLTDAFGLPGLAYETAAEYGGAMWNAYQKYPEMQSEYTRGSITPLIFFSSEPYKLISPKKQIKVLDDLKGLKIRTLGGPATTQMKALGAAPLSIPMPDNYISLQKGVMDAMSSTSEAVSIWRFYEVVKYVTYAPLPVSSFCIGMNARQWKKIPAETQAKIMEICGYEGSVSYSAAYMDYYVEQMPITSANNGHELTYYTLPEDEVAKWIEASQPAFDEYFEYTSKRGVEATARKLVDDLMNGTL